MNDSLLLYGAYGSLATSIAIVTYGLAATPPVVSPHLGRRGMARQRALAENRMFARIEPLMRFVAGLFARLPLTRARARADVQLTASGDYLGLSADEYFALSFLGGVAGMVLGVAVTWGFFRDGLDFSFLMDQDFTFSGIVMDPVIVPEFRMVHVVQSALSIAVVGIAASIYPAHQATRIDVGEALKFE